MRKLHPIGPHEVLVRAGSVRAPDGAVESFTVHAVPADRFVVRVELPDVALWHLTVAADGAPERLETRLSADGRSIDATCTFFEDEVLIWRRGAEPASEAVALPPGYRLLWPPIAGREVCLAGATPDAGRPEALMCALVRRRPPAKGWLGIRPVKFTLRRTPDGFALDTPGLPPMAATLNEDGSLARWTEGEGVWVAEG